MIKPDIIVELMNAYALPLLGLHGVSHWGRVLETGQKLAAQNGADAAVVEYFAAFHDSRRHAEGEDPDHGRRGAELVKEFRMRLELTEHQMKELKYACLDHSKGTTEGSLTVRTCWDSDRLDLWRVGVHPTGSLLCTEAGTDQGLLEWARFRSIEEYVPECSREWLQLLETS
jgi:uncharacterized protein